MACESSRDRTWTRRISGTRKIPDRPQQRLTKDSVFSVPWTTITSSLDTIADAHSALAAKLDTELERPLRDFPTKSREMQAVTTSQGNLTALAKDVEKAQQKTEGLQGKSTNLRLVEEGESLQS